MIVPPTAASPATTSPSGTRLDTAQEAITKRDREDDQVSGVEVAQTDSADDGDIRGGDSGLTVNEGVNQSFEASQEGEDRERGSVLNVVV